MIMLFQGCHSYSLKDLPVIWPAFHFSSLFFRMSLRQTFTMNLINKWKPGLETKAQTLKDIPVEHFKIQSM